jgi:hypothetical protein
MEKLDTSNTDNDTDFFDNAIRGQIFEVYIPEKILTDNQ